MNVGKVVMKWQKNNKVEHRIMNKLFTPEESHIFGFIRTDLKTISPTWTDGRKDICLQIVQL